MPYSLIINPIEFEEICYSSTRDSIISLHSNTIESSSVWWLTHIWYNILWICTFTFCVLLDYRRTNNFIKRQMKNCQSDIVSIKLMEYNTYPYLKLSNCVKMHCHRCVSLNSITLFIYSVVRVYICIYIMNLNTI